jgi:hypothetical protein
MALTDKVLARILTIYDISPNVIGRQFKNFIGLFENSNVGKSK